MADQFKRGAFLDSFWDVSDLIPNSRSIKRKIKPVELEEIVADEGNKNISEDNTVITRRIAPAQREQYVTFEKTDVYYPENSLLHEIILKKRTSALRFYENFEYEALKYYSIEEAESEYEPFFSYVPQYDQLNEKQKKYYFYWRSLVRKGDYKDTDYSYILLYIFELLNCADESNAIKHQEMLTEIWNNYGKRYPMLSSKLINWICDFGLVHRLPPPKNLKKEMVFSAQSLKEYFISVPDNDYEACAETLLKYCSSYDYHSSKFSKGNNEKIFDKHIRGVLRCAVKHYSENGKILSRLSYEDSKMTRDAFAGALCTDKNRYIIEIKYCSFSCSNELRFLIGDIIKYAENKIRAKLGIKSKLTVYSITSELQEKIERYFNESANDISPAKAPKKEAPQEYDVLYDVPVKPLSLSDALKIEESSWDTTNELVSAFEENVDVIESTPIETFVAEDAISAAADNEDTEIKAALGELYNIAVAIKSKDKQKLLALTKGKMIDAIVDQINEISTDVIGDILIEEDENGEFVLVDCYSDIIE